MAFPGVDQTSLAGNRAECHYPASRSAGRTDTGQYFVELPEIIPEGIVVGEMHCSIKQPSGKGASSGEKLAP
jgi:hypothetical protein